MSTLRIERDEDLAIVRMDKARGNAIDDKMLGDLDRTFHDLGGDDSVRGILLASAHPRLFSPGLDLVELSKYDRPAMAGFMLKFATVIWGLYELRKPMIAAISGHAIAGGCVLALTADYRILRRGSVQIGLNEVKVGVPLPWSIAVLLRSTTAPPALARIALLGQNLSDQEAVTAGLVDELADRDGFEGVCLERLREFAEKDAFALGTSKGYLRANALREMRAHECERISDFLDGWFAPASQERIRQIAASLGGKSGAGEDHPER